MLINMPRTSKKSVVRVKKNSKNKVNKKIKDHVPLKIDTSVSQNISKSGSEPTTTIHSRKLKRKRKQKLSTNSIDPTSRKKLKIEDRFEKEKEEKNNESVYKHQICNRPNKTTTTMARKLERSKRNKKRKRDTKVLSTEETSIIRNMNDERIQNLRNSHKIKTEMLQKMIVVNPQNINGSKKKSQEPESLKDRMMAKLRASRFRFLNEQLYNNESLESKKYFKEDPDAFAAYHEGYRQQVEQWPLNPLDIIIASIKNMPKEHVIADFGCGDARLAESVPHKVHSLDLVALNDRVKACDMAHAPLLTSGVHVVVFCLSLMGTNLGDYLIEANRVLKKDGILKIAEVESRFDNPEYFIKLLVEYGFVNTWKDLSHNLFYFMDFKKESDIDSKKRKKLPAIVLKTCLYKKR